MFNYSFNEIRPQVRTPENGPFGITHDDNEGFSHEEWATIPPIPLSMKGVSFNEFNAVLRTALESLLLSCDFSLLTKEQKEIVTILYDGYNGYHWVKENEYEVKKEYSCQDLAVRNWLDETNQKYWSRLNWDIIETSFERRSDEWIREELEWAKEVGVNFKKNWEYRKPTSSWSYWGRNYYGASWSVSGI